MGMTEALNFPSRSVLFNIEPIGKGTPYVESLSGYISRLARYHCVLTGTLLSKFLSQHLNKYYVTQIGERGGNGFYDSSNGINGIGKQARDFINVIQSLNRRTDLNKTTLIDWSNVFPTRGLMRTEKAWCPCCYQESQENNESIYDQLIWNIKEVHCCAKHQITLESRCNNCSKTMQIFSRNTIPGYCQHCHQWLGAKIQPKTIESTQESIKITALIGEMLAYCSSENFITFDQSVVSQSFKKILELQFEGKVGRMAKQLSFPQTTLRYWIKGINLTPLPSLIVICLKLNLSILELLGFNEFPKKVILADVPFINKSLGPRNKFDYVVIKRILENEIKSSHPQSLTKVSERIGCDRKLLYKKFPIESEKIVKNFQRFVRERKINRQKVIKRELMIITNQLSEKNEYPSRRKVEHLLDQKYFVKEKSVREQWNRLKG